MPASFARRSRIPALVLIPAVLAGCGPDGPNNADTGMIVGGVAGGIIGNQVGKGTGNVLATVAGAIWILNTRSATHAEIESSLEIAQGFAEATIRDLASKGELGHLSERLPQELRSLRHVRLLLMVDGKLNMVAPVSVHGEHLSRWAPKWFAALVGPNMAGRSIRVVSASRADPVIIIGEPADEIAEAWRDFASLAIIWLTLDALVIDHKAALTQLEIDHASPVSTVAMCERQNR